ncbi:MAG: ferredoxin family protein [Firmicutes bacterium]|nr:ferredoxin family protein [Bacillota bacterium]
MAKDWYPIIDEEKCSGCLICANFCPHDVYEIVDERPLVVRPDNCISRCHGCENQCPELAIRYYGDNGDFIPSGGGIIEL